MEMQYFDSLTDKINSANTCEGLTSIEADITIELNKQLAGAQATINKLAPVVTPPTNPGQAVTWIQNFIALITAPYNEAISMTTTIPLKAVELANSIAAKRSELGCS
jgi:hypothetical protein